MDNDRLRPDVLACIRIAEYRGRHNLSLPAKIFVSRAAFVELAETEGSGLISRASGGHKLNGVPVVVFDSDDPLEIYLSEEEERGNRYDSIDDGPLL